MHESNDLANIKRRPVGKGMWRMTVQELIESERTSLQQLRAIANLHPRDAETQRLALLAALESGERLGKLQELAHYREPEAAHDS